MLIGAIQKSIKESWRSSFTSKLVTSEKKHASKMASYLKGEYAKGVDRYIERGAVGATDDLFKNTDLKNFYIDIYESIGVEFAVWYERNLDKFLSKSSGNRSTWAEKFAEVGATQAGAKVVIVQGTALTQLVGTIDKLFRDEEFQGLGRAQQGRILKSRFNQISTYQAERIVRTEATNAANQGIMASARDIFGENSLEKEWIASGDSRTRSLSRGDNAEHLAMDGTRVDYKERFSVPYSGGIDLMLHPGDPSAHAVNVINCRCSTAVLPKEGAQVREGVELTGFGGGLAARGTSLVGDQLVAAPKPAPAPVVEEVIDFDKLTKKQVDQFFIDEFESQGIKIKSVNSGNLKMTEYRSRAKHFKKLSDEYNLSSKENTALKDGIELHFKRDGRALGKVSRAVLTPGREYPEYHMDGMLKRVNFGNTSVKKYERNQVSKTKFDRHFAKTSKENDDLYVLTHEFAHIISDADYNTNPNFWKEFKEIKTKYFTDLNKYRYDDWTPIEIDGQRRLTKYKNLDKYNDTAISNYAHKNDDEILAEAFTEYKLSDNPRRWPREFGELIDKYFKK